MLKRPVTRYWTSAAGGSVPPAGASSLVFLVLSTSDLLLYSVTAFLAWELASNVYSAANAANRAWMRDSVRDDNVGARLDLQTVLAMRSDESGLIDGALVNGSANLIGALSGVVRRIQTGYLYSYAFWMMIGLAGLLAWFLVFA